jgi:uncharacterized membrane protein
MKALSAASSTNQLQRNEPFRAWVWCAVGIWGGAWLATGSALSTRLQLVFDYSTLPTVTPELEVLAVSPGMLAVLLVIGAGLVALAGLAQPFGDTKRTRWWWIGIASGSVACFPLLLLILRCVSEAIPAPSWWELVWFSVGTGIAACAWTGSASWQSGPDVGIARGRQASSGAVACLIAAVGSCSLWWYAQAIQMWLQFQMGFNDFGHFMLRVIRTQRGQGFLEETPVLPPFWDHFNPGLLLLVPLWWGIPSTYMVFGLQAICLACSSFLVFAIARARELSSWTALCLALGWLLLPSVGQMNLAYTYGWHPITLAIPFMLGSCLALIQGRRMVALGLIVLAASFEEGVLVAVGCYAAMRCLHTLWWMRGIGSRTSAIESSDGLERPNPLEMGWRAWLIVWIVSSVCFILIYRFSGLAEFQTGRFASLGQHPLEIIISPFLKTTTFFELLLRPRNAAFLGLLLGPFLLFASKRFAWALLAIALPMLVLILWEHMPAQSIAFQYPSSLLPILFVGAIDVCARPNRVITESAAWHVDPRAMGFAVACAILGLFVGQMPWSLDSLVEVKAKTFGIDGGDRRDVGSTDQLWLMTQLRGIRKQGVERSDGEHIPLQELRILATGRIAAHCLGAKDIETVGQFWQRYDGLKNLDLNSPSPILRYDWIVLDHREGFQQTREETDRVKQEAIRFGFRVLRSEHSVDILESPSRQRDGGRTERL